MQAHFDTLSMEYVEGELFEPDNYWIVRFDETEDVPFSNKETAEQVYKTQVHLNQRVDLIEYWNDSTYDETAVETIL